MLKGILRRVFKAVSGLQQWAESNNTTEGINRTAHPKVTEGRELMSGGVARPQYKVVNLWEYLVFKEGTQAHHITKVLDYEEWVGMEEILRRVNELFSITYQNERSLYPYLKTLVDSGLLEANMIGSKMRWRKRNLLITIGEEEDEIRITQPIPLDRTQ